MVVFFGGATIVEQRRIDRLADRCSRLLGKPPLVRVPKGTQGKVPRTAAAAETPPEADETKGFGCPGRPVEHGLRATARGCTFEDELEAI